MDSNVANLFLYQWQRKVVALFSALILWLFINGSIIDTKTIPNVPIRIINLPSDKTIVGLLPNRLLTKRIALTLTGTRDVIQELEPGDLEVLLDLSSIDSDEWVVHIGKKNLISLNPSIDLIRHITQVSHPEFVLKLSPILTAKIPIKILPPVGEAPNGYEFLDIWPHKLVQTVTGPQEEVQALKSKGLELVFNLSEISQADLEHAKVAYSSDDELSFAIPDKWKKVAIPFYSYLYEDLNDPEAHHLRINFLRKGYYALDVQIPLALFYPLKYSNQLNPTTYPLKINSFVREEQKLSIFTPKLYISNVSKRFIDVVSNYMQIVVVVAPRVERKALAWSVEVVNPNELEQTYVNGIMAESTKETHGHHGQHRREEVFRKRFQKYLKHLNLYTSPEKPLHLDCYLGDGQVIVESR